MAVAENSHEADDAAAGNSHVLQSDQVTDATGVLDETSKRALEDLGRIINDAMDDLAQSANEYAHLSLSGSFSAPLEKAISLLERQCNELEEKGVGPEQLEKVRRSLEEMKERFDLLRKAQEKVAVAKGVRMVAGGRSEVNAVQEGGLKVGEVQRGVLKVTGEIQEGQAEEMFERARQRSRPDFLIQ